MPDILKETESVGKGDQEWRRFERKFFVSPEKISFARCMLGHLCSRDPKYPTGTINSLYFDTPDLEHHQKSDDGSYERDKIRIRWYDDSASQKGGVPVYLERKSKKGFASRKHRRRFLVDSERLNKLQSDNTIIDRDLMKLTLFEFGYFSEDSLMPVILVSYKRYRFVEILTSTRLSLDWQVSSVLANQSLGHCNTNIMLEGGVIEIKGPSMTIPLSLRSLVDIGIDWTRFSKYAGCLESQTEKPGSVGRIWPSGRIEPL